jgi:hypothetical protein
MSFLAYVKPGRSGEDLARAFVPDDGLPDAETLKELDLCLSKRSAKDGVIMMGKQVWLLYGGSRGESLADVG